MACLSIFPYSLPALSLYPSDPTFIRIKLSLLHAAEDRSAGYEVANQKYYGFRKMPVTLKQFPFPS